ncbi:hypothetical protein TeGR_g2737, partial [Tetraparma gracilis]
MSTLLHSSPSPTCSLSLPGGGALSFLSSAAALTPSASHPLPHAAHRAIHLSGDGEDGAPAIILILSRDGLTASVLSFSPSAGFATLLSHSSPHRLSCPVLFHP